MRRWRVLDERDQKELMAVVLSRPWTGRFVPWSEKLHGGSGVDIRTARKAAYNAATGIFSALRTKRGAAPFAAPIAPAIRAGVNNYLVKPFTAALLGPEDRSNHGEDRGRSFLKTTSQPTHLPEYVTVPLAQR